MEERDGELVISGNSCPRGEDYARTEVTNPVRTVTSTVVVTGGERPVVAVKTKPEIPKGKIADCMAEIKRFTAHAPVEIGDVLIKGIAGTESDLVATARVGTA